MPHSSLVQDSIQYTMNPPADTSSSDARDVNDLIETKNVTKHIAQKAGDEFAKLQAEKQANPGLSLPSGE